MFQLTLGCLCNGSLNGCKHSHGSNVLPGQCACEFLFQSQLSCAVLCSSLDCLSAEGQIAAKWSIGVTSELLTVCTSGSFPFHWRQLQGRTLNEGGDSQPKQQRGVKSQFEFSCFRCRFDLDELGKNWGEGVCFNLKVFFQNKRKHYTY